MDDIASHADVLRGASHVPVANEYELSVRIR